MGQVDDTPTIVSSDEELVDALMATYGLTEEQARHQAQTAKSWRPDLEPPPATTDPRDWLHP